MLNEIIDISGIHSEAEQRSLFFRVLEIARKSNVPESFGSAFLNVADQVPNFIKLLNAGNSPDQVPYLDVAFRLFQYKFDSREEAVYALQYSNTISNFKKWDYINKQLEEVQAERAEHKKEYDGLIQRYANSLNCDPGDVVELTKNRLIVADALNFYNGEVIKYDPVIAKIRDLADVQEKAAMFSARFVLLTEKNATGTSGEKLGDLVSRRLSNLGKTRVTSETFAKVRGFVENYFGNQQNASRIPLLAVSR